MATAVAKANGLWSDTTGATWTGGSGAGGSPADGDSFTIGALYTITFDANQSAFVTGVKCTVNGLAGVLQASTNPGTYCLMLGANLSGSGKLLIGNVTTPYPVNCDFTINGQGTYSIALSAAGSTLIYDTEPTLRYCKLSAGVAAGATVLPVDQDVTAGVSWTTFTRKTVDVCNVAQGAKVDSMTIASATANSITLTAGLTNAKISGSYIVLTSRHVQLLNCVLANASGSTYQCALIHTTAAPITAKNCTFPGAISGPGTYAFYASGCVANIVSGTLTNKGSADGTAIGTRITGLVAGCGVVFNGSLNPYLSGIAAGCGTVVSGGSNAIINGLITGSVTGVSSADAKLMANAIFSSNSIDIGPGEVIGRGATLGSATQVSYTTAQAATLPIPYYCDIWNNGGVAGARRAWTTGGYVMTQASVQHPSYGLAYQFVPSVANQPTFIQDTFFVDPGSTLALCLWGKMDTLGMGLLAQLFTEDQDPFYGGTPQVATSFSNNTNWQVSEMLLRNTSNYPVVLTLRVSCAGASGNAYAGWRRRVSIRERIA